MTLYGLLKNGSVSVTNQIINRVLNEGQLAHRDRYATTLDQIKNVNPSTDTLHATFNDHIQYSLLPIETKKAINVGEQIVAALDSIVPNKEAAAAYCNDLHSTAQNLSCLKTQDFNILEHEQLRVSSNFIQDLRVVNTTKLNEIFFNSVGSSRPFTELLFNHLKPSAEDLQYLISCHDFLINSPVISTLTLNYTLVTILGPNEFLAVYGSISNPKILTESIKCCIIQKQSEINYNWFQEKRLQFTTPVFGFLLFGVVALAFKPSLDPAMLQNTAEAAVSSLGSSNTPGSSNTQVNINIFINIAKSFKGLFGSPSSDSALTFFKGLLKKD